MVFEDLSHNGSTFNWAGDVDALDEEVGSLIDATSTKLTAFKSGGGNWQVAHDAEVTRSVQRGDVAYAALG
ncbi:hypothetical protein C8035_v000763 [Colletotrichum spinosum]|uniref:Uncharacterized protein n=1 Tax=Colletotrichum spinosum TaxID=1347390 RepID=A0A4R8Q1W5_9PEZI|nr:hypothetical protein C8035_v000763 [Colletotrichum spinosum]